MVGDDSRRLFRPNSWGRVAGYKAIETADLQGPDRNGNHIDLDQAQAQTQRGGSHSMHVDSTNQ
jgi:hypothetical protein